MPSLNVQKLPLDEKVLIEASAGTGKTFTIGLIVVRLLLEKCLPIKKIVLITFTKAATAELKKNTSEKIIEAYDIWKNGSDKEDDLTAIVKNAKKENSQAREANLLEAIACMDEMPVFTIHGFCERLLGEFAFETGNFEEREIVTDLSDIKERVIAEFWRRKIRDLDEAMELKPEDLSKSANAVLNYPNAKFEGEEYENAEDEKGKKYAIVYELAKEIREKLAEEKKKLKVMDFNDMIENCHKAVNKDNGKGVLQNAVKNRYAAILVDEFQDTDKMQFEIFDYLFKGKPFFMIGDPKQAIYRFRGGDIFAYREAGNSAGENQFSMSTNYRSEQTVLDALNLFFKTNSFELKMGNGIKCEKIICGRKEFKPCREKDGKYPAFVIWKGKDEENKPEFESKTQRAVIAEIKRLLSTGEFEPKNIAILLDSNKDCLAYKKALAKERIYAIVSGGSVFESESANFLRILLNAICCNNNIRYIRSLLTHSFSGFAPKEIDGVFIEWANAIYETKTKWKNSGIMNAIDFFMTELNLWSSIATGVNGERNITNIRQIMESLNEEEIKFGRIPEKINNRFATLCEEAKENEETEERLETDEDALRIMTIHKSKGLQFDIVFVPDISRSPRNHVFPDAYVYHSGKEKTIAYFAKDEARKDLSHKEENEENVRLLYVALTRAKFRLYVAFSPCKKKKDGKVSKAAGASSVCREIFENFSVQNNNIAVEYLDDILENSYSYDSKKDDKEQEMHPKKLPENFSIAPSWRRTSFTGISQKLKHREHIRISQELKIPAGKRMGTLLHSIFENLDFGAGESEIRDMVESKLGGFREFSKETKEGLGRREWVENKINTILQKKLEGHAGELREIDNRVAELNFFMRSENINLKRIKEIMNDRIYDFETENLFAKYIKGAIDLVFLGKDGKYYILDWKSNSLNEFSKGSMDVAMQEHGYHLQYYIYAVALKRWLEQTHENFDFKEQFGGIYYIFIRGVNEENFDGIYYVSGADLADSIAELDECFKGI